MNKGPSNSKKIIENKCLEHVLIFYVKPVKYEIKIKSGLNWNFKFNLFIFKKMGDVEN